VQALQCVDDVVCEPEGGSQNDPEAAAAILGDRLRHHLGELRAQPIDRLLEERYRKFRNIAQFYTTA
jgi:acetyl-CoA carboxylase carboxyl transferase subunit alpha